MSDLINGREMLKRYQEDLCYGIACKDCSMCTEDGGCRVEEWIDKFPSADRPQEWIPCSERLPSEEKATFLVCTDSEHMCSCRWTNTNPIWTDLTTEWHWCIFDIPQYSKVVAWMPLKPWKGADDYERAIEQMEHDMLYEPTYNSEDGSM